MDNLGDAPRKDRSDKGGPIHWGTFGLVIGLMVLCSCATAPRFSGPVARPAEQPMNAGAGKGDVIYVTLRVNGHRDALFVVDTGSSSTLLDSSLSGELGKPLGKITASDGTTGQKVKLTRYRAPSLFLGETRLPTRSAMVTGDLTVAREATGHPIMGILGMDCLQNYCLQLDFDAGKLRFLDPDTPADTNSGTAFPLNMVGGVPVIGENFLGVPKFTTLVDTGYSDSGSLTAALRKDAPDRIGSMITNGLSFSISGDHATREGRFTNCVLGGEVYDLVLGDDYSTSMGLRFLARHEVTLNFPKMKLYLKRRTNEVMADEGRMTGFSIVRKGDETVVLDVEAGGPAELAGVRVGDKLVELDGTPANTLEMWEIKALFKSGDGKELLLTLRRGDETVQTKLVLKRRV